MESIQSYEGSGLVLSRKSGYEAGDTKVRVEVARRVDAGRAAGGSASLSAAEQKLKMCL